MSREKISHSEQRADGDQLLGKNLSFAATEAYKLLRTNLFFCLRPSEEKTSFAVGVTSSIQGEGKSTTSINLAYMLAEDGKRVCLIEGDMRAPTLANRLKTQSESGLSRVLAGLRRVSDALYQTTLHENLQVITAGEMPPNPAELLGSQRMAELVEELKKTFDYIIVDLPPITVVADALAVSGALDGVVVVVEDGICTKRELSDAMQRLDVIKDKILGFIVTHALSGNGGYGRKRYGYGRYGHYGHYGYGHYGYQAQEKDQKEQKAKK